MTTITEKKSDLGYTVPEEILLKHSRALEAARNYWVLHLPTGMLDEEFDLLEQKAREDGLELRDYVCQEIQGTRSENADYITKIPKKQIDSDMYEAIIAFTNEYRASTGEELYWIPKYDGSSLAAYYDTATGRCIRVVTVGGSNLGSSGIDQTKKLARYFPNLPNTGICAIQAECLVPLECGYGESSRQKANGLVNSKFLDDQVDSLIAIRGFRYFLDPSHPKSMILANMSYREVMSRIPVVYNMAGKCKFSMGFVNTVEELLPDQVNKDIWKTNTGTFLVDGLVAYSQAGVCIQALKYKDAGRREIAEVLGIKWNNQISKGKDSWSANALITPVTVRGSKCTKPTVGSIKKMLTTGLSKGAKVTIIMANSTIPQVSEVLEQGNLDFEWPTCSCGHTMDQNDIFGALLKCGNPNCSERYHRMLNYLRGLKELSDLNLDNLLVIDRFKWSEKADLEIVIPGVWNIISENRGSAALMEYLSPYTTTALQKKNLQLVINPAYNALCQRLSEILTQEQS